MINISGQNNFDPGYKWDYDFWGGDWAGQSMQQPGLGNPLTGTDWFDYSNGSGSFGGFGAGGSSLGIGGNNPFDPNLLNPGLTDQDAQSVASNTSGVKVDATTSIDLDPFSYVSIIQDLNRFRSSARAEYAIADMPGQVFFRVLFHFNNGSDVQVAQPGTRDQDWGPYKANSWTGLIAPSWLDFGAVSLNQIASSAQQSLEELWSHSTAFNYLILNNELARAKNLQRFVELLSTISSETPWYFQSIKGLDTAIDRAVANGDFTFKEERDKITIECMEDSYDERIGTLLDLYRSIVWSWETKRVMLPSNLRKFDMTIVAFELPVKGLHITRDKFRMDESERYTTSKQESSLEHLAIDGSGRLVVVYDGAGGGINPVASYKAWEFHGCEIDYNSSKSAWAELSNAEGTVPKYNIDIYFDDVYEIRFNQWMKQHVTDLMGDTSPVYIDQWAWNVEDLDGKDKKEAAIVSTDPDQTDNVYTNADTELPLRTNIPKYSDPRPGPQNQSPVNGKNIHGNKTRRTGILDQAIGAAEYWLTSKIKKAYLGNMNGLSIAKVRQQVESALGGDLFGTINNVRSYFQESYIGRNGAQLGENIFPQQSGSEHIVHLGNIFKANTVLNT